MPKLRTLVIHTLIAFTQTSTALAYAIVQHANRSYPYLNRSFPNAKYHRQIYQPLFPKHRLLPLSTSTALSYLSTVVTTATACTWLQSNNPTTSLTSPLSTVHQPLAYILVILVLPNHYCMQLLLPKMSRIFLAYDNYPNQTRILLFYSQNVVAEAPPSTRRRWWKGGRWWWAGRTQAGRARYGPLRLIQCS